MQLLQIFDWFSGGCYTVDKVFWLVARADAMQLLWCFVWFSGHCYAVDKVF